MSQPELSIVIPVYNEEARLGKTLDQTLGYLKSKAIHSEILVVDDGSKDGTLRVAEQSGQSGSALIAFRLLKHGVNRGKGAAVRTGALAAKGKVVLYMDADNATPLSEFENFRPFLEKGIQVLVGSRAVDRKRVKIHQPLYREAMGRIFNLLVQLVTIPGLWDTQCGFKAFTQKAAGVIFPLQTIERFGFDVELLYIARKHNLPIAEIPVQWFDSPDSRVRVVRDSFSMLKDLLAIRWNDLKGIYGRRQKP